MARCCVAAAALALALVLAAPAAGAAHTHPDPAAGWHGRAIAQPHHHPHARTQALVPGWSAGPVRLGTGLHRAHGSRRVREVQTRLTRLGYRPGPIDGLYGPRTQAAASWFQIKHGLPRTGTATLATVRHLRARTQPRPAASRPAPSPPRLAPSNPTAVVAGQPAGFTWWPWLIAALAVAVAVGALVAHRRPAPASSVTRPRPRALGYIRTPHGESDAGLETYVTALEDECRARGLALEAIVTDQLDDRPAHQRPGLTHALERLQSDELDCLVVGRVEQLTDRQVELHDTLGRISRHGAVLVVLNTGPHLDPTPARSAPTHHPERAHA